MVTELNNATISKLQIETITMRDQTQRTLLKAECKINDRDGVMCHGFEVWGQDSIQQLGLKEGKTYNVKCVLRGRLFGGRYSYSLQAYNAEEVQQTQPQAQIQEPIKEMF